MGTTWLMCSTCSTTPNSVLLLSDLEFKRMKEILIPLFIVALTCVASVFGFCGDHPKHIEKHNANNHILLGSVKLQYSWTYLSCRELCRNHHPDFEFYQKYDKYHSCDCMKMTGGVAITLKDHGAYTFGYSNYCPSGCDDKRRNCERTLVPRFGCGDKETIFFCRKSCDICIPCNTNNDCPAELPFCTGGFNDGYCNLGAIGDPCTGAYGYQQCASGACKNGRCVQDLD